jgi:Mg2+/Co2+ transporter CorC
MDDSPDNTDPKPTLLERLSAFLTREPEDREELLQLLHGAFERKLLDADALSMIEGVMSVSEMTVRDIMIPRAQMDVVSQDDSPEEFIPLVLETKHSRFPVVGENKDDVVGILLAKELLNYYANPESFDLKDTFRPVVFVPESKRLNVLLRDFRANRNHMAIVVDEYGGVSGLVTIEDVLEQIVGDIEDEYDFDESEDNIIAETNGRYRVKAQTEIADFNEHFGTDFADDEFDTVGGLVLQAFGRLPKRGETTTIGDFRFRVIRAGQPPAVHAASRTACPNTCRRRRAALPGMRERRRAKPGAGPHAAWREGEPAPSPTLFIAAIALGAATVFGFAPFAFSGVPVVTLALLFALWQNAPSARNAAWIGFGFGLGLLEVGASWLYIALHNFGGMPLPLAAIGTAGFCAYLALYPALAGWLAVRWTPPRSLARVVAAAAAWTLTEWMRSLDIAGFPWLIVGYSQLTQSTSSPLAGYAPLGGVWLVTLAIALCAAALVMAIDAFATPARTRGLAFILGGVALAGVGTLLARIEWTAPVGEPVAVSLLQGNVTQELKFDPTFRDNTFRIYEEMVNASRGRLIVLPESAYPMFAEEIPEPVVQHLLQTGQDARRRCPGRHVHHRPAAARTRRAALLQHRGQSRLASTAALSQTPPRAVR